MASTDWDPQQYEQFKAQRSEPFWDLADLVDARTVRDAVDLGCGTGELTARLAERLEVTRMVGIDDSPAMLAAAAPHAAASVQFTSGDIATWGSDTPAAYDLVFANASLQWVPDHPTVLRRWVGALRPGGQIAVQVPANDDHDSHLASSYVAAREPFLSAFDGAPPPDPVDVNVLPPADYARVLYDLGVERPHVRLQVYPHVMPSSEGVVEWTRGTSLTRFFTRLPDEMHEPFVRAYRDELLARIGDHRPYFYAFKRILMYGRI